MGNSRNRRVFHNKNVCFDKVIHNFEKITVDNPYLSTISVDCPQKAKYTAENNRIFCG